MKKFSLFGLIILLTMPLLADRTYTQTFTTAFSLNASATKTNGTDFTSTEVKVSEETAARAALLTLTFTRAAGSATLTVAFYFQVSYDGGTTWADFRDPIADAEYFNVITGHSVISGTTVRASQIIALNGVSHIRLAKVVNNDSANNLTAVNAAISF